MKAKTSQTANQERLDVLLAMAIAYNRQKTGEGVDADEADAASIESLQKNPPASENILELLSALSRPDIILARERFGYYDALTEVEKQDWESRILSRVRSDDLRLDTDVHYTQVAVVLQNEPPYIGDFILQRLSPELYSNVADVLKREIKIAEQPGDNSPNPNLANLIRRRFLASFVTREELQELKPLALLSGMDMLELLQRLGRNEIAFVCRGVKDVENLAPFLRRFETIDSQAILEQMTNLKTVEKKRLDKAEALVKEAWQAEKDASLIVQLIGLFKLAVSLKDSDQIFVRYTLQKLPVNLADKIEKRFEKLRKQSLEVETYRSETETVAARILLDRMNSN